jgi:hypothetical protein
VARQLLRCFDTQKRITISSYQHTIYTAKGMPPNFDSFRLGAYTLIMDVEEPDDPFVKFADAAAADAAAAAARAADADDDADGTGNFNMLGAIRQYSKDLYDGRRRVSSDIGMDKRTHRDLGFAALIAQHTAALAEKDAQIAKLKAANKVAKKEKEAMQVVVAKLVGALASAGRLLSAGRSWTLSAGRLLAERARG